MPRLRLVLGTLTLALLPFTVQAATITVRQGGGGDATTINGGIAKMASGDTLVIGAGHYDEIVTDYAGIGGYTVPVPSGSSWASATTIKAETPGTVTLTVSALPDGWPSLIEFDNNSHYIMLEGLVLDGQFRVGSGFGVSASHHIRLKDIEIKNAKDQGIGGDCTGCEFLNLHVHHSAWTATGDATCTPASCPTTCGKATNFCLQTPDIYGYAACHGYCHAIYLAGRENRIEGGQWHDNDAYGIHLYPGISDSVIRCVEVFNNGVTGIGLFGGSGNTLEAVTVYHNKAQGIWVKTGNTTLKDSVVTDNGENVVDGSGSLVIQNTQIGGALARPPDCPTVRPPPPPPPPPKPKLPAPYNLRVVVR